MAFPFKQWCFWTNLAFRRRSHENYEDDHFVSRGDGLWCHRVGAEINHIPPAELASSLSLRLVLRGFEMWKRELLLLHETGNISRASDTTARAWGF